MKKMKRMKERERVNGGAVNKASSKQKQEEKLANDEWMRVAHS